MTGKSGVTLGFVGTGAMGGALARGTAASGFCPANSIVAFDPDGSRLDELVQATGCRKSSSAEECARESDVIVICVKPQAVPSALQDIAAVVDASKLVISIAAGVSIAQIESHLHPGSAVIRVMPNTPAMVGVGASAIAKGSHATSEHLDLAKSIFEAVGLVVLVEERLMDAITGLSGSGPAFAYMVIEAMSDAGVSVGLARDASLKLAAQTVLGAATMVMETGKHPATLRDAVTSPGGTTIAGCAELERSGLRAALINAIQAAVRRSAEMSK